MTTNLLNLLSNEFSGNMVNHLAGTLGEDPTKTQTALGSILPALLDGLINKASTPAGAHGLLDLLRENNFGGGQFTNVASAVSQPDGILKLIGLGGPLVASVLGTQAETVTNWVSTLSGIKKSSASSLMSLALPFVLGTIGQKVSGAGWSVSSLTNLLTSQKSYLQGSSLPNLAASEGSVRATTAQLDPAPRKATTTPPLAYVSEPERTRTAWWKWALPLLALLALIPLVTYLTAKRDDTDQRETAQPAPTPGLAATPQASAAPVASTALPLISSLGAFGERKLPNGVVLNIPSQGVESKLINFIEDTNRQVDKNTWFSFDRLEFETDSANLKPSSGEQLRNVSEILKAYPQVKIKIGGYTDNTGNDAHNLKLSNDRATNTMNEIAKLGIDKGRLAAEGYGKQFPISDNSTEEGRMKNRRIDIRVTKK